MMTNNDRKLNILVALAAGRVDARARVHVPDFDRADFCDCRPNSGQAHVIVLLPDDLEIVGWTYWGNGTRRDVWEGDAYEWGVAGAPHGAQLTAWLREGDAQAMLAEVVEAHNARRDSDRYTPERQAANDRLHDAREAFASALQQAIERDIDSVWRIDEWVDLWVNGGDHPALVLADDGILDAAGLADWCETVTDDECSQRLHYAFDLAEEIEDVVCEFLDDHGDDHGDDRIHGVWRLAVAMGWRTQAQYDEARED